MFHISINIKPIIIIIIYLQKQAGQKNRERENERNNVSYPPTRLERGSMDWIGPNRRKQNAKSRVGIFLVLFVLILLCIYYFLAVYIPIDISLFFKTSFEC